MAVVVQQYLFGPVSSAFARQHLLCQQRRGECLIFDHTAEVDVHLHADDTWESFSSRLPRGFRPQFLVLLLQYRILPPWLFSAPLPIIALAGDWNLLWHHYRCCLPWCDLVLSDPRGVEVMHQEGIDQAVCATLFGCERHFVEAMPRAHKRDIDLLFVGNFHPAVQSERLRWLARLAPFCRNWNVVLTTGVFGDQYRTLLSRARIVFNRSVRGEANNRTFEAIAAGALLFQEAGNREVSHLLRDGHECVFYDEKSLEPLLTYYLEHEDRRQAIAETAQSKSAHFTFEALWDQNLAIIEQQWTSLCARTLRRTSTPGRQLQLLARVWQLASGTLGADPSLAEALAEANRMAPRCAPLSSALGTALSFSSCEDLGTIAACFQHAWSCDPRHVVAGMNLALLLERLGQQEFAGQQAERVLAMLDAFAEPFPQAFEMVPYTTDYDFFRVEWEKAAWEHAGNHDAEFAAKTALLRWQLQRLLARSRGDLVHEFEACLLQAAIPISRASLGCALLREKRIAESLPHLRLALQANPFDGDTARVFHQALGLAGQTAPQKAFSRERQLLSQAAPTLIPPEPWFAKEPTRPVLNSPSHPFRIHWQGTQDALHSLAHVNREICLRLIQRGHELALLPSPSPDLGRQRMEFPHCSGYATDVTWRRPRSSFFITGLRTSRHLPRGTGSLCNPGSMAASPWTGFRR